MKITNVLVWAGALCGVAAMGADMPEVQVPWADAAPSLEADQAGAGWEAAAVLEGFRIVGREDTSLPHRARVVADDDWLYVGFDVKQGPDRLPVAYGWHQTELDRKIHREDHVAVSFDPDAAGGHFYQFWINRDNVRAESRFSATAGWELDWDIPWRSETVETETGWRAVLALPWRALLDGADVDNLRLNLMARTINPRRDPHGVILEQEVIDASWAPVTEGFRDRAAFGRLSLPAEIEPAPIFLPLLRRMAISPYTRREGRTMYRVVAGVEEVGGAAGAVHLELEDRPAGGDGTRIIEEAALAGNEEREITWWVPVTALERRTVSLTAVDAATGRRYQTIAHKNPPEFDVFTAYLHQNYYTDEPSATAVAHMGLPPEMIEGTTLVARRRGASRPLVRVPVTDPVQSVPIPLGRLQPGRHTVELAWMRERERLAETELTLIRRAPRPEGEWKIDRARRVLLTDGEPFFPFGIVAECDADDYHFGVIAGMGFNTVLQWRDARGEDVAGAGEAARAYLDRAQAHGLQVVLRPSVYTRWNEETRLRDPGGVLDAEGLDRINQRLQALGGSFARMKSVLLGEPFRTLALPQKSALYLEYLENNRAYIESAVRAASGHPALSGYFILDEPVLETGAAAAGQAFYRMLNDLDGYHPVFVNYSSSIPNTPDAVNWSDLLGTDPYWVPGGVPGGARATIQFVPRIVDMTRRRADAVRSVTWTMPMAEYWSGATKRALTGAEQRCQSYLAMIHGAKGLIYFKYPLMSHEMLRTFTELAREIEVLGPACVLPPVEHAIRYDPGVLDPVGNRFTDIQAAVKRHPEGGYILMAANSAHHPVDVEITVAGLGGAGAGFERLFADAVPVLSGDVFRDRFEAMGTRAYALPGRLAEPLDVTIVMRARPEEATPETGYTREGRVGMRNLLPNPSYEEATIEGWPDYHKKVWGIRRSVESLIGGTEQNWGLSTTEPFHGDHCLVLRTADEEDRVIAYSDVLVKLDAPATYVFSAWLRADREDVEVSLNTGPYIVRREQTFRVGTEWTRHHVSVPLPAGHHYVMQMVILRDNPGETAVWIDAVQFEEGEEPTAFQP